MRSIRRALELGAQGVEVDVYFIDGELIVFHDATLAAIAQKLPELPAGAKVLGFNYDTGERYLSVEGFLPA